MSTAAVTNERPDGIVEIVVDCALPGISVEEVGRIVGYPDGCLPAHFADIIAQALSGLGDSCAVRAGYRIVPVTHVAGRGDGLVVGGRFFSLQRIITAQLRRAEQAALFACTVGRGMEEVAAALFHEGDPVKGHFVDTIASVAVERVADALHNEIESAVRASGLSVTNRFSPGYCGWPVNEQHALFDFFPENFCGIAITDSALMLPKKSVSGIIGIGPLAKREPYFCDRCSSKECTYRQFLLSRSKKERM